MKQVTTKCYTAPQILRGLKQIWKDDLGCWFPPDPNTEVAGSSWSFDELDFADVILVIQKFFGFRAEWTEWEELISRPNFTYKALAEFIAERTEVISLEPISILGSPCRTAGIFRAIERVAKLEMPAIERFAPSTPIRDRFRGPALIDFWNRIRWLSEDKVPVLLEPKIIQMIGWAFIFGLVAIPLYFGVAMFGAMFNLPVFVHPLLFLAACVGLEIVLIVAHRILLNLINPLPESIRSFADLARTWGLN
ncbi:MAG TPA: hypothetical protein VGX70_18395 [Gemmataceae bacterium]|nr:hypothetical protein [Gemmataceae bacterium]